MDPLPQNASRPAGRWRRLARRPLDLRTRLLLTIAVVSTLAALVVGVGAVLALQTIAVNQVDAQLATAAQRSVTPYDGDRDPAAPPPGDESSAPEDVPGTASAAQSSLVRDLLQRPGQAEGTLLARSDPGSGVSAAVLDGSGTAQVLTGEAATVLASAGTTPTTVNLPGFGDYRVISEPGPAGGTLITGLPLSAVQAIAYRLAAAVGLVTLLVLGLALAIGSALARIALHPLDRVRATATQVSELPLDQGDVVLAERVPNPQPTTEVGQLTGAFNRMLEHVASALESRQRSELRLRRFVADASHELRTPLASIRGYAELVRRREKDLPPDVTHALGRVESEAMRMGSLVEDMLLLARLDEKRPLDRELVDLAALVRGAVADARVAGPDHLWRTELPDQETLVLGDQARLTQMVVNLLANARTHTPPGTRVTVTLTSGSTGEGDHAELCVRDDGPGMPPGLATEAFERFTRGDSSRSRAAGSTGLGLAIVDALVRAHEGSVRLDSAPGRGTAVTIRLPLAVLEERSETVAVVRG